MTAAAVAITTIAAITAAAVVAISAAGPLFTRAGSIDSQFSITEALSIELLDGLFSLVLGAHGDKGETFRTSCIAILDQGHFIDCADLGEQIAQFIFCGFVG